MAYAIVIDASLARAAGLSADPTALKCVQVLDAVLENGYLMAMSQPLKDEWLKSRSPNVMLYPHYASRYAMEWWVRMTSASRVVWINLSDTADIRLRILDAVSKHDRTQVEKDLHLVETALASDRRMLSLDDRIRRHLSTAGRAVPELCSILWLNPRTSPTVVWLQDGAPDEMHYRLCAGNP